MLLCTNNYTEGRDPMSADTKYQRIANELREKIQNKEFKLSEKLPSEYQLTAQYGVSRQTVRDALEVLQEQRLIERIQGKGSFVINHNPITKIPTFNVGVIVPELTNTSMFPVMLRSITDVLQVNGYSTLFAETKDRFDVERHVLQNMLDKQVDGIILGGTKCILPSPNLSCFAALTEAGIPYTFIHTRPSEFPEAVHVSMDNQQGGWLITNYLIRHGYRKIGCALKLHSIQGIARYQGFQKAMSEAGLFVSDDSVLWFSCAADLRTYSREKLRGVSECEAVVCFNDYTAALLTSRLQEMGRRVHDDICITGFDGTDPNNFFVSPQPENGWPEVGAVAAQTLLKQIRGEKVSPTIFRWIIPAD